MSAWDIAGAVVWTPLALICWTGLLFFPKRLEEDGTNGTAAGGAILFGLAAAFCIARLCGAHT